MENQNQSTQPKHEWWVLATSYKQAALVVWCRITGARGLVKKVTQAELADGYNAIENSYRWMDEDRVEIVEHSQVKADLAAAYR